MPISVLRMVFASSVVYNTKSHALQHQELRMPISVPRMVCASSAFLERELHRKVMPTLPLTLPPR